MSFEDDKCFVIFLRVHNMRTKSCLFGHQMTGLPDLLENEVAVLGLRRGFPGTIVFQLSLIVW